LAPHNPNPHEIRGPREGPVQSTLGTLLRARVLGAATPETEWVSLLQAIASGDQRALCNLHGRMRVLVFTLVLRIVQDRHTAEEVTLDVFQDIWTRASEFRPDSGTVVGWIMNQARSRAIDQVRFQRAQKRVNPFPDLGDATVADSAAEDLDASDRASRLRAAVAHLTPAERSAVEMAFFFDHSYAEAAQQLYEPEGTVKTRIRSALEKLRQALDREMRS
jgi:RNA polymerase sigma-70 factor (ECF subfamily)